MNDLTESLRQFLQAFVPGLEELEVLLLARRWRGRSLDADDVVNELKLERDIAVAVLAKLAELELLRERSRVLGTYEFAVSAALEPQVEELERTYAEQRFAVVAAIGANAMERVKKSATRAFAEVFIADKGRPRER